MMGMSENIEKWNGAYKFRCGSNCVAIDKSCSLARRGRQRMRERKLKGEASTTLREDASVLNIFTVFEVVLVRPFMLPHYVYRNSSPHPDLFRRVCEQSP